MRLQSYQWPDIQKEMLDKMNKNPLYSSKKYYLNVLEGRENLNLSLEHKSGSAPPQFWLTVSLRDGRDCPKGFKLPKFIRNKFHYNYFIFLY